MILFTILLIMAAIVLMAAILAVGSVGAAGILLFAEPIICVLLIVWLVKRAKNKRNKK